MTKVSWLGLKTSFFSDSTQPDEPTTIRTLRDRLNEIEALVSVNKIIASAPPLPESSEPILTVAQLFTGGNEALNMPMAILLSPDTIANSEDTTNSTDHSLIPTVFVIVILALCYQYYLMYSNNHHDDESIQGLIARP